MLSDDIDHRMKQYTKCISKSTTNFLTWLRDDYKNNLRAYLRKNFDKYNRFYYILRSLL